MTKQERRELIEEECYNIDSSLSPKYGGTWGKHPIFTKEDWQLEVSNNDTVRGYWEWVTTKIDQEYQELKDQEKCAVCEDFMDTDGDNWDDLCPGCADKVSDYMDFSNKDRDAAIEFIRDNLEWDLTDELDTEDEEENNSEPTTKD